MDKIVKDYLKNMSVLDRASLYLESLKFGFSPTLAIIIDTLRSKEAIKKYRSYMEKMDTDEIMKGQAFGL